MKKIPVVILTTALCLCLFVPQAQNVGIGETAPGAKLVVKATALGKALLVKNSDNDSVLMTEHFNVHIGGVHTSSNGVLAVSNKNLLPLDPAQLQLVAAGERSGANVNGSLSMLHMMNANTNKYWSFSAYSGADVTRRNLNISFYDPDAGFSNSMLFIKPNGSIGVGNINPAEKLDVTGNIKVSGELNRASSGAANLVPVAYGNISATAFIHSGSSNFTVSKITTGWYAIDINDESYQFQVYSALVTPVGSTTPIVTGTGSGGGALYVYTYNLAGTATDSQFSFVVYKQ